MLNRKDGRGWNEACKPPELASGLDFMNLVLALIHVVTIQRK